MGDISVIPASKQGTILESIHKSHFEIEKCKARPKICVYWPNINGTIEQLVKECFICNRYSQANHRELLLLHCVHSCPWEKIGADYFPIATQDNILVIEPF